MLQIDLHTSLSQTLQYRAQTEPNRLAYRFLSEDVDDIVEITYQALDHQARCIAAKLQQLDLPGKRAVLLYPAGLDFLATLLGCFYSGTIAIPLPAIHASWLKRKQENIQHIIRDADPTIILTTQAMGRVIRPAFRANAAMPRTRWLFTDTIDPVLSEQWQPYIASQTDIALLQYTSGSTRTPRGVKISHGNLMHNNERIRRGFGHSTESHAVLWLPHHHDMGLVGILQGIYTGFEQTLMSPLTFLQHPLRWLQAISDYRATTSGGPNFAFARCIQTISPAQRDTLDLSSWDLAFIGAEPIRADTLARFADFFRPAGFQETAWFPSYGLAESTVMVTGPPKQEAPTVLTLDAQALGQGFLAPPAQPDAQTFTPVGCGFSWDGHIRIVDPNTLTLCEPDQIGEIWIASESVSIGYWNNPTATEASFDAYLKKTGEGPFLRTGDLGFYRDENLFVTGRIKELIIIRGHNFYPHDIEATIETCHPALQKGGCAAFSIEHEHSEVLVLALELDRQTSRTHHIYENRILGAQDSIVEQEILSKIRSAVSAVHDLHVHDVLLIPFGHLPKTSSGKIKRFVCRERYLTLTQAQ